MKKIKAIVGLLLLMVGQVVAQTTKYDTDRGFIHPGGLHTQEDFDRVKAQLAAGNNKVKQAWQKLTASEYSQSGVQTYPTEIIVRGGGNGENYMNAARGAAMAFQNALRWKIAGTKANANAAVRILMQWARTTKGIGGDSNYALAAGLYGYQFAQAAELMRDYEGWSREDFEEFKRWMLTVWYPTSIGFLRGRNGTWENAGKWWQAPGHYWSNWGLCNALCVISIGILCDDVFIYNQGMSYIKYDQCGTFSHPRTEVPIKNDGLTEFMGNFVVTTYESKLEKWTRRRSLIDVARCDARRGEGGLESGRRPLCLYDTISLKPTTFGYQLKDNWLGRSPFTGDAYMTNTYMDNLRIYNTALTADQVQALADQRPTSKTVGAPSGIHEIGQLDNLQIYHSVYDLQGRRVDNGQWSAVNDQWPMVRSAEGRLQGKNGQLKKGIYIINGKKVLVNSY